MSITSNVPPDASETEATSRLFYFAVRIASGLRLHTPKICLSISHVVLRPGLIRAVAGPLVSANSVSFHLFLALAMQSPRFPQRK
jgi:hypothetical protein